MDIEAFRDYCLGLPGTTEGVKFGDNLCFMIEEKIYIMCNLTPPHSFCFKVEPEIFDQLVTRNGITQPAYLAKRHWAGVANLEVLSERELKERVAHSRALVLSKLTKKIQQKYLKE